MRRVRGAAACLVALVLGAGAPLRAQAPGEARVVPVQVTGDAQARFSMVILGDGYTAAELPKFHRDVERHLNILWSIEPFRSYRSYFNVYAVEVASEESGITCDPDRPAQRRTALGLHFDGGCTNPNARGVLVRNDTLVREWAKLATPHFNQVLVIANTDTYGGIGGSVATTTADNAISPLITAHELGHSLGRLQDEYTYRQRGVRGGFYSGDEPGSVHHTLLGEADMKAQQKKWWRWLGEESEAGGRIGRFEGGLYSVAGVWRPSRHSMMISLGYYFDQVSRERMTTRIATYTQLIADATPGATVARDQVVWIETPGPVYRDLDITWMLDGREVTPRRHARQLDLGALAVGAGEHTLTVKVVDATSFVRDPSIRDSVLTATRSWRVSGDAVRAASIAPGFTSTTGNARPIGGQDVVYAHTTQPGDRVLDVRWTLDGRPLAVDPSDRSLALAALQLAPGTHTLEARVQDPAAGASAVTSAPLRWTIDNTAPRVSYALSDTSMAVTRADGVRHYLVRDSFTMKLAATDDQPGHVVAEFRLNGDGWHHYYGWPDAPAGTPYRFTPRGTVIKELVYGSLAAEGLSPQPWEAREPGWGTHRVEYRAIDAAGNIAEPREFHVTVVPTPQCTQTLRGRQRGDVVVGEGVTCLENAQVSGSVTVRPGASLFATGSSIGGGLSAANAAMVVLVKSSVRGTVQLTGTRTEPVFFDSRVAGSMVH